MKANIANNPKIKLLLGIAIPIMVMIVTIVMIGASFAWFSTSAEVYIETINVSTKAAYSLSFDTTQNESNILYMGQTAIGADSKLVLSSLERDGDKPYCFVKTVKITSAGRTVDINIEIDGADIYSIIRDDAGAPVLDANGNEQRTNKNSYANQVENIPYAFTWFFTEHKDGVDGKAQNWTGTSIENGEMMDYLPETGEVWYTPYGKLTFARNEDNTRSYIATLNNKSLSDLENYDSATNKFVSMQTADIERFTTGEEELQYDFFIVFAPQELFFRQFFQGLDDNTIQEVYSNDVVAHMLGTTKENIASAIKQMYYSKYEYQGSTFAFSALINVSKLYEESETA